MVSTAPVVKRAIMLQRSRYVAICGSLKGKTDRYDLHYSLVSVKFSKQKSWTYFDPTLTASIASPFFRRYLRSHGSHVDLV